MRSFESIAAAASQHGLVMRGGFVVDTDDDVPEVGRGAAEYLLLVGHAGSAMWDAFSRSVEYRDGRLDPLNRWSERIGNALADAFSARALFPFGGPPYRPFLRWAKKAEALQNSQLGMLIHPRFGLWHAYRFALAFAERPEWAHSTPGESPATDSRGGNICQRCKPKPCLRACPVNAFTGAGYDVESCFHYLEANPESACMTHGCQARGACPQGAGHRYQPCHAAFHMRAFVESLSKQARPFRPAPEMEF